jgi:hypothetical protein
MKAGQSGAVTHPALTNHRPGNGRIPCATLPAQEVQADMRGYKNKDAGASLSIRVRRTIGPWSLNLFVLNLKIQCN